MAVRRTSYAGKAYGLWLQSVRVPYISPCTSGSKSMHFGQQVNKAKPQRGLILVASHRNGWLPVSDAYDIGSTSGGFDTLKNQCLMLECSATKPQRGALVWNAAQQSPIGGISSLSNVES